MNRVPIGPHSANYLNPLIVTDRLILRPPQPGDAESIVRYVNLNRDHLTIWEPLRTPEFYTLAYQQEQIRREQMERERRSSIRFYLWERDRGDSPILGMISLSNFVRGVGQFCTLGYALAHAAQGRGYMSEAVNGVVEFCFNNLNLHRVEANYIPRNERSGNVLRRCGFVVEGYARDYLQINGKWEDHILTARLNPNWQGAL